MMRSVINICGFPVYSMWLCWRANCTYAIMDISVQHYTSIFIFMTLLCQCCLWFLG